MEIVLNGQPRQTDADATVATLIAELGLDPRQLAVERNLQLVPRSQHPATRLEPGDRIEVVTLVGGG